jgi:hypothetical protein
MCAAVVIVVVSAVVAVVVVAVLLVSSSSLMVLTLKRGTAHPTAPNTNRYTTPTHHRHTHPEPKHKQTKHLLSEPLCCGGCLLLPSFSLLLLLVVVDVAMTVDATLYNCNGYM